MHVGLSERLYSKKKKFLRVRPQLNKNAQSLKITNRHLVSVRKKGRGGAVLKMNNHTGKPVSEVNEGKTTNQIRQMQEMTSFKEFPQRETLTSKLDIKRLLQVEESLIEREKGRGGGRQNLDVQRQKSKKKKKNRKKKRKKGKEKKKRKKRKTYGSLLPPPL